jgi:protein SCO1/2
MKSHLFLLWAALFAASVSTSAHAEQIFQVSGVVRGQLDDGQVVIQHDEIRGYMPAMTMAFTVSNSAEAARLQNGDRVQFQFRVTETKSVAENFRVTGRDASPSHATSPAATPRARLREGELVPEFSLRDQNDQPFTSAALRGRLTVVTFIFTRCPVPEYCPAMARRFGQLQKAIAADAKLAARARLLSITLDPEFDRPSVLKAYGAAVGANSDLWQFATGAKDEIAALTKAFAVINERNGTTLDHTLCTALIGDDGRVLEIWRGNGWKLDEVLTALTTACAKRPSAGNSALHAEIAGADGIETRPASRSR